MKQTEKVHTFRKRFMKSKDSTAILMITLLHLVIVLITQFLNYAPFGWHSLKRNMQIAKD